MCLLVAVGFEWRIVQRGFVPRCRYFYRRLLCHVLDFDMGFAFIGWACSKCAEGSCDSNVPFCDRYSTQIHVGLIAFHLLSSLGGILLVGHTRCLSLLLGLLLHSR